MRFIGRKKGRELRLRVSRVFLDWAETGTKELGTSLNLISPGGGNNLCTAAVRCRILPDEKAELPPGSYSITLPDIPGLDPSKRTVQDVKIGAADKTILDVRMDTGRPVVGVTRDLRLWVPIRIVFRLTLVLKRLAVSL